MRKFLLLAAGVALTGGVLAACVGGPPPPPPTDPHDILVVGDSVGFSFGCALGDPGELNGVPQSSCPGPSSPGYTTRNDWTGACTMAPGTLSLYNGNQAAAPNCDTVAGGSRGETWQQDAFHYVPKVVIINTAGWEIQDRWENLVAAPDYQWGGPTNGQEYQNAAAYYSNELNNAINMFRGSPNNPTVIVTNAPYISPPQPEPPPQDVPAGVECSWWEPFPQVPQPSTGPDCTGNATAGSGGTWRSPTGNTTYRSSHDKLDQFNAIVNQVKSQYHGGDNKVVVFNFKSHFNAGPANTYTNYVCPPPHDTDTTAQNLPDLRPSSPTFGQMVWQCDDNHDGNPLNYVNAILARAADQGHLSSAGQDQILKPYIDKCVRNYLNLSGGDQTACN
ncbi:MAG TPA: hypothetical protein VFA62_04930 [Acidimicrobiia bacterium]|nr:hypothetical protein [Acidimicrobiia bacterium]